MILGTGITRIGAGKNSLDIITKYINIGYMDKELELELVKKYPKILRDYGGDPMQTCLSFGIETESGWYNLLDKCMEKLQYFCDICSKNGEDVQVFANQIKSKYATLRFYYSGEGGTKIEWDIIDDIINQAEAESARTCEISGKHGEACKKGGWYMTLSYEEARKLGYVACNESTEAYWKEKDAKGEKNDDREKPETT